eukprot:366441-Chlamydomonas_euryale.AAC.30
MVAVVWWAYARTFERCVICVIWTPGPLLTALRSPAPRACHHTCVGHHICVTDLWSSAPHACRRVHAQPTRVKVSTSVPIASTGMAAKLVYELPLRHVSRFWQPPARLGVRYGQQRSQEVAACVHAASLYVGRRL